MILDDISKGEVEWKYLKVKGLAMERTVLSCYTVTMKMDNTCWSLMTKLF